MADLEFRPADTGNLPPLAEEGLYRMGEVCIPLAGEGMGIMLDPKTNIVVGLAPGGPAMSAHVLATH